MYNTDKKQFYTLLLPGIAFTVITAVAFLDGELSMDDNELLFTLMFIVPTVVTFYYFGWRNHNLVPCPSCGERSMKNSNYCDKCGEKITHN